MVITKEDRGEGMETCEWEVLVGERQVAPEEKAEKKEQFKV